MSGCQCPPMTRRHILIAIGAVLITHFLVVQLAKAGCLKIDSVGHVRF